MDKVNGFSCICPSGTTGLACEMSTCSPFTLRGQCQRSHLFADLDECASQPCQGNATCVDLINGYACECSLGFAGRNCEISSSSTPP